MASISSNLIPISQGLDNLLTEFNLKKTDIKIQANPLNKNVVLLFPTGVMKIVNSIEEWKKETFLLTYLKETNSVVNIIKDVCFFESTPSVVTPSVVTPSVVTPSVDSKSNPMKIMRFGIVMEKLEHSLFEHKCENNIDEFKTIFHNCLYHLFKIHEKDVYHLDIKPTNIMISKNGIKYIDFGSAMSHISSDQKNLSHQTTIHYRPPEQIVFCMEMHKFSKLDLEKMDIYSLGITMIWVLYKICHLGMLFPFSGSTEYDQLMKIMSFGGRTNPNLEEDLFVGTCLSFIYDPLNYKEDKMFDILTGGSPGLKELLLSMITINPVNRPSTKDLFNSDYFKMP